MSTSTLLQQLLQQNFNLASATVKWIRYRALYITWISLLIEWRHQSKIWCPFLCTAGFVYACVRLLCTGTQANCGNYGDVLKWLRPLKTKGLRGIRAYSTVCNSYHGGRTNCTKNPTVFICCANIMTDYFITARMISLMHSFEYWSPATVGCSWIR